MCDKGSTLTLGVDNGKMVQVPSLSWYIEDAEKKILVDTGMCDTERANAFHYRGSIQKGEQRIDRILKRRGIEPEDIEIVILTHLHWDHCYNLELFKNAQFIVQKTELSFALDPLPPYYKSYESPFIGLRPSFEDKTFVLLNGEYNVCSGVDMIVTPGHSPGHQSVVVDLESGVAVIAGDAVMVWENLEGKPEERIPFIMPGRYMDMISTWRSMEKIKNIADIVLPGHEIGVCSQDEYS